MTLTSNTRAWKRIVFGALLMAVTLGMLPANGQKLTVENDPYHKDNVSLGVYLRNVACDLGGSFRGDWFFFSRQGNQSVSDDDMHFIVPRAQGYIFDAESGEEYMMNEIGARYAGVDGENRVFSVLARRAENLTDPAEFSVELRMKLIRDVVTYEYRIKNESGRTRRFGFRTYQRVFFQEETYPATWYTYYFPGKDPFVDPMEVVGTQVPDEWFTRYSGDDGIWRIRQPFVGDGLTKPDRLVFAQETAVKAYSWPRILGVGAGEDGVAKPETFWDVWGDAGYHEVSFRDSQDDIREAAATDAEAAARSSFAVGQYYSPRTLRANEVWTIRGQIRLDYLRQKVENQYLAAVGGPDTIRYREGDDPSTPGVVEDGYFSPQQFLVPVTAYHDSRYVTLPVSVTLILPDGLELGDGEELIKTTNALSGISAEAHGAFAVRPTGTVSGRLPITMQATFGKGTQAKTLISTTYVNVAAPSKRRFPVGAYMTGFPFRFAKPDPDNAIGGATVSLWGYDPRLKRYVGTDEGLVLEPGVGYWMLIPPYMGSQTLIMKNASPVGTEHTIPLYRGWNMVSNPFQYGIEWNRCRITDDATGLVYDINDAIKQGLVRSYMWQWDNNTGEYINPLAVSSTGYVKLELKPYVGYWMYAQKDVYLTYRNTSEQNWWYFAPPVSRSRATRAPGEWAVNVKVTAGTAKDTTNFFGVVNDAGAVQERNMLEAPPSPNGLAAYFVPRDLSGRSTEPCASEYQTKNMQNAWTLEVVCPRANEEVTVSWPDLTEVPRRTSLYLKDEVSGKTVYMRTKRGYTFNSGQGGMRRFTITAGDANKPLTVSPFRQEKSRSGEVTVTYGLSEPATVTAKFRTATGKVVRTITIPEGDSGVIVWDGRDDKGRAQATGTYLCEIYVERADGYSKREVRTVNLF